MLRAGLAALGVAAGLGLAAAGACQRRSDAPPSCGEVAARFALLTQQALEGAAIDGPARRAALAQLPTTRDALGAACATTQWSGGVRRCLHAARELMALGGCWQDLTEIQRRALDTAARGVTDPP